MMTETGENISMADHAAAIVEGRAETNYVGSTRTISLRLPASFYAEIQALAHVSGKSRNNTMVMLFEVGMEAIRSRISEETAQRLREIQSEYFAEMIATEKE